LGGALLLVGSVSPWVSGRDPSGQLHVIYGFTDAGDGAVALGFGVLLIVVLASRSIADSQTRVVQLLPAILAVASLLYMLVAVRSLPITESELVNLGVVPVVGAGIWIETLGAAVAFVAGVAASARMIATNPTHRDAAGAADLLDARFVLGLLWRMAGALVGLAVAVWIALQLYASTASPFVPAFGMIGIAVGLWVTGRVRPRRGWISPP
jgi:hypothetical protein